MVTGSAPNVQASRLGELRKHIASYQSVLVCFSAGIDSTLLLAVATEQLGERCVGMTAISPSLPQSELSEARHLADRLHATVHFVESHEIDRPEYARNDSDRCFHCKTELYDLAETQRKQLGLKVIINGTNADDLGDYRPGLAAAKKAGIISPLLELGFTKSEVRAAALELGLAVWDKPAAACLSSRIPYGTSVTRERLAQVEQFEAKLKQIGLRQVRVRWHDKIARIEVDLHDIPLVVDPQNRSHIVEMGRECGFKYTTLDLAGYRIGSLNELLVGKSLRTI